MAAEQRRLEKFSERIGNDYAEIAKLMVEMERNVSETTNHMDTMVNHTAPRITHLARLWEEQISSAGVPKPEPGRRMRVDSQNDTESSFGRKP